MTESLKDLLNCIAMEIFDRIGEDIRDRRELKTAWKSIPSDVIKDEIYPVWREIIIEEFTRHLMTFYEFGTESLQGNSHENPN